MSVVEALKQAAGSRDRRPSDKVAAQRKVSFFKLVLFFFSYITPQSRLSKNRQG